jgi:hypothetical protein
MNTVLGVDAGKAGWVGIAWSDAHITPHYAATIADLADAAGPLSVIAIDIPIGLPDHGPRQADLLARAFIRHPGRRGRRGGLAVRRVLTRHRGPDPHRRRPARVRQGRQPGLPPPRGTHHSGTPSARGPAWLDTVPLLINVRVDGGHPDLTTIDADLNDLKGVVTGLAGFFADAAHQPPPPGLPTLRAFQHAQADAVIGWLKEMDSR